VGQVVADRPGERFAIAAAQRCHREQMGLVPGQATAVRREQQVQRRADAQVQALDDADQNRLLACTISRHVKIGVGGQRLVRLTGTDGSEVGGHHAVQPVHLGVAHARCGITRRHRLHFEPDLQDLAVGFDAEARQADRPRVLDRQRTLCHKTLNRLAHRCQADAVTVGDTAHRQHLLGQQAAGHQRAVKVQVSLVGQGIDAAGRAVVGGRPGQWSGAHGESGKHHGQAPGAA